MNPLPDIVHVYEKLQTKAVSDAGPTPGEDFTQ
jgi:hypothetical protein